MLRDRRTYWRSSDCCSARWRTAAAVARTFHATLCLLVWRHVRTSGGDAEIHIGRSRGRDGAIHAPLIASRLHCVLMRGRTGEATRRAAALGSLVIRDPPAPDAAPTWGSRAEDELLVALVLSRRYTRCFYLLRDSLSLYDCHSFLAMERACIMVCMSGQTCSCASGSQSTDNSWCSAVVKH